MNLENLWAEIEADQTWRTDEIRFFQNQCEILNSDDKKDQFRRATILLLYAHFEGFCKFAFTLYIKTINQEGLKCSDANFAIAAASLDDLFKALRDPSIKSDLFRRALPDDSKLHRFARDREFIEYSADFGNRTVVLPDALVDTESNLKPIVLRKLLFRLGFAHDQFADIEGNIDLLLNFRNKIAHGQMKDGVSQGNYENLRDSTFEIMTTVKSNIMDALTNKIYLRQQA